MVSFIHLLLLLTDWETPGRCGLCHNLRMMYPPGLFGKSCRMRHDDAMLDDEGWRSLLPIVGADRRRGQPDVR